MVAAGQPAGAVDQHRLHRGVERIGQPDLGAAFLVEFGEPRAPGKWLCREPSLAPRSLRSDRRRFCHKIRR